MRDINTASKNFRESFRGFNKDDVAEFISALYRENNESETVFKNYIKKLEEKLNKYKKDSTGIAPGDSVNEISAKLNTIDNINFYEKGEDESAKLNASREKNVINELTDELAGVRREAAFMDFAVAALEKKSGILLSDIFTHETIKKRNVSEIVYNEERIKHETVTEVKNDERYLELEGELEALRARCAEYEKQVFEADILRQQLGELKKKLADMEQQTGEESTIYKSVTSELGEVIFSAKKKSDIIIANAKTEADRIITEANENKNLTLLDLNNRIADLRDKYKGLKQDFAETFEHYSKHHELFFDSLLETDEKIDNIYKKLQ